MGGNQEEKSGRHDMRHIIEKNPILSIIVAIGVTLGAMTTIQNSFSRFDALICTEAEAREMIQQQMVPMLRDNTEYQINQLKNQIFVLKQKKQYNKDEPWEADLLEDLENELDRLKEKKQELR